MLDRAIFLNPTFAVSAMIAFGTASGMQVFTKIDAGNVGKFTLEFMLYLTVTTTGIAGILSSRTVPALIRKCADMLMTGCLKAFLGSIFGIVATFIGLLAYLIYAQTWDSIPIAIAIVTYLTIFSIQPILWVKATKDIVSQNTTNWYFKPKFPVARATLYAGLILLGSLGLYGMF